MKRLLAFLLCLGLLFSLTACDDGQEIPDASEPVPATPDEPFQPLAPEQVPPVGQPPEEGMKPPEGDPKPGARPPEGEAVPTLPMGEMPTEPNVLPLPPQEGGEVPVQKPGDSQTPPSQKPVPGEQTTPKPPQPTVPTVTQPGNEPTVCGHTYQTVSSQAPGCTQAGYQNRHCSKCGDTKQELQQPLGHAFIDATCTNPKSCSRCGQTDGSPLGHSYSGDSCSRCGDVYVPHRTVTIYLKATGNVPVPGVMVEVYIGENYAEMAGRCVSDSSGTVQFNLKNHSGRYKLVLVEIPAGYTARTDSYTFKSDSGSILLNAVSVVTPEDHSKAGYKVGSTMGDFTITDVDGKTYQLSRLLKSKKLVILNFWYCSCVPCKASFPILTRSTANTAAKSKFLP